MQGPADCSFHFVPDPSFAGHFDTFALDKGWNRHQNHHVVERFRVGRIGAYFEPNAADIVGNLDAAFDKLYRAGE